MSPPEDRAAWRATAAGRRARGLCADCGADAGGRSRCLVHLAAHAARGRSARTQYTAKTLALVDGLLAQCAARHGVTPEAARSRRTAPALAARYEWIRVLRDTWALSASETARMVGMDHASVLYALGRRGPR